MLSHQSCRNFFSTCRNYWGFFCTCQHCQRFFRTCQGFFGTCQGTCWNWCVLWNFLIFSMVLQNSCWRFFSPCTHRCPWCWLSLFFWGRDCSHGDNWRKQYVQYYMLIIFILKFFLCSRSLRGTKQCFWSQSDWKCSSLPGLRCVLIFSFFCRGSSVK